jgi:membrane protein YdbS with pleckstrin-like domain
MLEVFKEAIKKLLKVPGEPEAPFGAAGSVRVFRAAPGFFRYRMLDWSVRQFAALIGIILVLQFIAFDPTGTVGRIEEQMNQHQPLGDLGIYLSLTTLWEAFEILAIAAFFVQLPFSFLMVFLDYEYRWYVITDRSLRLREGLLRVDERTMTFSNIQNVSIRQGPLQRVFGISDLEVSTAGGGSGKAAKGEHELGARDLHRAFFRGIDNPAEVRDAILVHLRSLRASGLGDPEEEHRAAAQPTGAVAIGPEVLEAARGVLAETRALRQALR